MRFLKVLHADIALHLLRGVKKQCDASKNIALFKLTHRNVWFKASQCFS